MFADLPKMMKSRIKDVKETLVKNYCNDVVKAYLSLKDNYGNALWVDTDDKPNLERIATWAVRYQVLEDDFAAIAKRKGEKIQRPTIQKQVDGFLKLIELPKRPTSSGRRKGQKDDRDSSRQIRKLADLLN